MQGRPPEGLSPTAVRCVVNRDSDPKAVAAVAGTGLMLPRVAGIIAFLAGTALMAAAVPLLPTYTDTMQSPTQLAGALGERLPALILPPSHPTTLAGRASIGRTIALRRELPL